MSENNKSQMDKLMLMPEIVLVSSALIHIPKSYNMPDYRPK